MCVNDGTENVHSLTNVFETFCIEMLGNSK